MLATIVSAVILPFRKATSSEAAVISAVPEATELSDSTEAHVKDSIDLWQCHLVSMGVDGASGVDYLAIERRLAS